MIEMNWFYKYTLFFIKKISIKRQKNSGRIVYFILHNKRVCFFTSLIIIILNLKN